jgi:AmiR/NasT family two-component response regulator
MPLVLLIAQDTYETSTAARSAGVSAFFGKPMDIETLLDGVR